MAQYDDLIKRYRQARKNAQARARRLAKRYDISYDEAREMFGIPEWKVSAQEIAENPEYYRDIIDYMDEMRYSPQEMQAILGRKSEQTQLEEFEASPELQQRFSEGNIIYQRITGIINQTGVKKSSSTWLQSYLDNFIAREGFEDAMLALSFYGEDILEASTALVRYAMDSKTGSRISSLIARLVEQGTVERDNAEQATFEGQYMNVGDIDNGWDEVEESPFD